jgi:hypothetical protein
MYKVKAVVRAFLAAGIVVGMGLALPAHAGSQQEETYDHWRFNRDLIRRGQQAVFMCNGLFTSDRTLEQVFAQELAFLPHPVGTPEGGDYVVDRERKTVAVGAPGGTPTMRAVFREGLGCLILAPDQTFEDLDSLPILHMAPPAGVSFLSPPPESLISHARRAFGADDDESPPRQKENRSFRRALTSNASRRSK